jgi:acyl CoA:acetate/3-ketoacid CoA transferase alpha subunit
MRDEHDREEAIARIPDGASIMVGGFLAVGTPESPIDELCRQHKRELVKTDPAEKRISI